MSWIRCRVGSWRAPEWRRAGLPPPRCISGGPPPRGRAGSRPAQRLLMGEVGSGKTVVALFAMLRAVEHGCQAALMAPTETLAEQHFATIQTLMPGSLLSVGIL